MSTHKNVSLAICTQDFFAIPTIARRCAKLWVLWNSPDFTNMEVVERRVGMPDLSRLFNTYLTGEHDSMWIDHTARTPYPLRINAYQMVERPRGASEFYKKSKEDLEGGGARGRGGRRGKQMGLMRDAKRKSSRPKKSRPKTLEDIIAEHEKRQRGKGYDTESE